MRKGTGQQRQHLRYFDERTKRPDMMAETITDKLTSKKEESGHQDLETQLMLERPSVERSKLGESQPSPQISWLAPESRGLSPPPTQLPRSKKSRKHSV